MTDKNTTKNKQEIKKENQEKPMSPDPRIDRKHKEIGKKLNENEKEHGGQDGPDPTRYGDWEKGGRCTDF